MGYPCTNVFVFVKNVRIGFNFSSRMSDTKQLSTGSASPGELKKDGVTIVEIVDGVSGGGGGVNNKICHDNKAFENDSLGDAESGCGGSSSGTGGQREQKRRPQFRSFILEISITSTIKI